MEIEIFELILENPFIEMWKEQLLLFSVTKSGPTLCDLMDCSMPGFPVLH